MLDAKTAGIEAQDKLWSMFEFGDMTDELEQYCYPGKGGSIWNGASPTSGSNTCTACSTCAVGGCNTSSPGCK